MLATSNSNCVAGKGYVLGVSSAHVFRSWGKRPPVAGTAADLARTRRSSDWKRLSAGAGTKGPRLHDWCYLELADLEAEQSYSANDGLWTRGLLIRGRIADDDLAFFTTWCPAGTAIETLVAVEGHRWAIEDSFETAKNEFGLDHNESRSWHGWHRHVSLVMLAFAMMAAIRHRANPPPPKKTKRRPPAKAKTLTTPPLIRWSIRKSAALLSDLRGSEFNPHTLSHGPSGAELTRLPLNAPTSNQKSNLLGLPAAQGLVLTEGYYWDLNDRTRHFGERFFKRTGRMPNMVHAGTYSATLQYLKAVQAVGTKDSDAVAGKLRELPVDDDFASGKVLANDRMVHDMYLFEVKQPSKSKRPWDYYKLLATIPVIRPSFRRPRAVVLQRNETAPCRPRLAISFTGRAGYWR